MKGEMVIGYAYSIYFGPIVVQVVDIDQSDGYNYI